MNRFEDLLESFRQKSGDDRLIEGLKVLDSFPRERRSEKEHSLKMPYSSEPTPLDPAWD